MTQKEKHILKNKLVKEYGQKCYYCDKNFKYKELTFDHIFPKSLRQKTTLRLRKGVVEKIHYKYKTPDLTFGNSILACKECNYIKSNRIISIEDYRKERMGDEYYEIKEIFVKPSKVKKIKILTEEELALKSEKQRANLKRREINKQYHVDMQPKEFMGIVRPKKTIVERIIDFIS